MHATCTCPHDHAPLFDHPNSGLRTQPIMKCPEQLWGPPSLLLSVYMGLLMWGWSRWDTKLTTHSHLVPWLGMHKGIPPLPHMPLWRRPVQFYWYLVTEFSPTSCFSSPATPQFSDFLSPCSCLHKTDQVSHQNKATGKVTFRPASWSSGQSFWLLIMRSRVRFLGIFPWRGRFPWWPWCG
jgi:hypothetical protein